ncbi:MAG: S1 RNA-binding domain-containing protein [Candidatus Heimdallarchaeota archaeon]|nr:S1 RNA-binding domain-containing protein [Candidatus Heimdallarchaeota archaeon]
MVLNLVIRNVVDFGAFVDIGIKENGLIHVSKVTERSLSDIHSIVKVSDDAKVEVINLDAD